MAGTWIYYNRNDNYYQYRFSKEPCPCLSSESTAASATRSWNVCAARPAIPAEWVYNQLKPTIPDLSLATVYRNLAMFKAEGTIDSVGVYNGLERFDFRTDPHAHFICRVCGAVSDINWLELPADTLQEVEQQTGASVETCRIAVSGVCAACMKKDAQ